VGRVVLFGRNPVRHKRMAVLARAKDARLSRTRTAVMRTRADRSPRRVHGRRIRECGWDYREVDDDFSFAHSNDLTTVAALRRPRAALKAG
jgi:hypothetical protein